MMIHPVEDCAARATDAETLKEVLGIMSDLADLQVRTSRLAKRLAGGAVVQPVSDGADDVLQVIVAALNEEPESISGQKVNGVNQEINPPSHGFGLQQGVATPDKPKGWESATLQSHSDDPARGPLHHRPSDLGPNEQPASEETSCSQREPTALCDDRRGSQQESAGKEQRDTTGVAAGETAIESTSPSDHVPVMDGSPPAIHDVGQSMDGKACQADVAEGNRPSSLEDGELQRHEGHHAKGAGEDEASAMDRRSDPAPTIADQKDSGLYIGLEPAVPSGNQVEADRIANVQAAPDAPAPKFGGWESGPVISWNRKLIRVSGPKGYLDVPRRLFDVLVYMSDGNLYDLQTLMQKGGYVKGAELQDAFKVNKSRLAGIGIDLRSMGKELFMLKVVA